MRQMTLDVYSNNLTWSFLLKKMGTPIDEKMGDGRLR